jgi:hypothetical protein
MQDCLGVAKGVVVDHVLGGRGEGVDSLQVPAVRNETRRAVSSARHLRHHRIMDSWAWPCSPECGRVDSLRVVAHFFSLRFRHFSLLKSVLRPNLSCRSICLWMISSADIPCARSSVISSCDRRDCLASSESSMNSLVSVMSSVSSARAPAPGRGPLQRSCDLHLQA